jgi:hypothetical protein
VAILPFGVVLAALPEALVVDGEEPDLFQVGIGDAPATLQIEVEAVTEYIAQLLERVLRLYAFGFRIGGVISGL